MPRRLLLALSGLALVAAACGDDSSLGEIVAELESGAEQAEADEARNDGGEAIDSSADQPTEPAESTGSNGDAATLAEEQSVIETLSGGTSVPDDQASCFLDGMAAAGIAPLAVVNDTISLEEDILLSDLVLSCFDEPENLLGFVQNFAAGFALSAGFELSTSQASCLVAALDDNDVNFSDLEADTPPPVVASVVTSCLEIDSPLLPGDTYGDNAVLDLLWDECAAGIMTSCDELYGNSEIGSAYEAYGASCGDREPDGVGGTCGPFDYGDDSVLDSYWDACAAGDGAACDDLYFESPIGSVYEEFGDTCGYRYEESPGFCEAVLGADA